MPDLSQYEETDPPEPERKEFFSFMFTGILLLLCALAIGGLIVMLVIVPLTELTTRADKIALVEHALPAFALLGLVTAAAYFAAERRGRSPNWTPFTLLIAPLLLLLVCLPKKRDARTLESSFGKIVEVAGVLALLAVGGGTYYMIATTGSLDGVPLCDSSFTMGHAKSAFANSPTGKLKGLAIVALDHVQEVSGDDEGRRCRATALLNDAAEYPTIYEITKHGSQWFVSVRMGDQHGGGADAVSKLNDAEIARQTLQRLTEPVPKGARAKNTVAEPAKTDADEIGRRVEELLQNSATQPRAKP